MFPGFLLHTTMKKIILLIALSCMSFVLSLSAQDKKASMTFKSAIDYNNFIIDEQEKVGTCMNHLSQAVESGTPQDMNDALDTLQVQTKKSKNVIGKLGAYNNNKDFRNAAVKLFLFYYKISRKEFKKMVKVISKGDKITKKDISVIDTIDKSISAKETILDASFSEAQQKFARENNFTIGE